MFSSRVLLNLGLIVLLGALISFAVINSSEEKQPSAFSSLKKSDISSIQIEHRETITEIIKSGNIWNIQKPLAVEADEFRIHSILSILSAASNNYYEIDKADYKKFSLDTPLTTLTLNHQKFLFGSTSSVNNKRYVLTNNKLFLIDDTIYPLVASGFKNIMRRQLFSSNVNLTKIRFNDINVYKNSKQGWESENQEISSDVLKKFVDNWKYIQSYAVTDAAAPYSGTKVFFTVDNGKITELLIQQTDVNTTVINPKLGLSYQFDSSAFESLTQTNHYSADKK
jgi:Domain of unknown function (DUF4340)